MNLQTDYLRTFIALADTKGFTRAGRQVNRSQPAVSMQIKRLEDEIGKDVEKGELDVGICTQVSDGGQVISHDPVVWVADSGICPATPSNGIHRGV